MTRLTRKKSEQGTSLLTFYSPLPYPILFAPGDPLPPIFQNSNLGISYTHGWPSSGLGDTWSKKRTI
jgi:hypothetical protein